jgi:two-component system response regulator FixJ
VTAGRRVCIVDDDAAVRESLDALLVAEGFATETFGAPLDFLRDFDPEGVACILLDVRMPGMDGITLLETLAPRRGSAPVIMLTAHADVPMAVRAMRAGAADFIEKPFTPERLLDAMRAAMAGAPPARGRVPDEPTRERFAGLTPRETEVMRQMVIGLPNKLIARELGMSPRTVEIHRGRVMQKTGATSLSHLVRLAIRAGMDPDAG